MLTRIKDLESLKGHGHFRVAMGRLQRFLSGSEEERDCLLLWLGDINL